MFATFHHDRQRRWFFVGLVAFFLVLNVQYLFKISDNAHRSAIRRWTPQLLKLQGGENIWESHEYPNPPIMAMVLLPLTALSTNGGALAWFYLKTGMAIAAICLVFRMLESPERPFPFWGKAAAIMLSLRPIQGDLSHGNVNLFILFTLVAALYFFTRGKDVRAGLTLGLAIACKVTPALFLPYFVWKRAWKMVGATLVGCCLFFWAVPGLYFGWEKNQQFLASWYDGMVEPYLVEKQVTSEHQNQSLPGLLTRLLTDSPSFTDWIDGQTVALEHHNIAALAPEQVAWILKGCMALFALAVVLTCRTPLKARTDWRLTAEFGLIALGMLLFSERTWKHHGVVMLLPFATLAYAWCAVPLSEPVRRWVMISVVLAALLMLTTSTGLTNSLDRAGKLAQVYGAYVWAYLALATGLVVLLSARPPAPKRREDILVFASRIEVIHEPATPPRVTHPQPVRPV
jgi:alpha-1,2-mannosyltransferase